MSTSVPVKMVDEFSDFEEQFRSTADEKMRLLSRHGRLKHLIFGAQLTPELLDKLCRLADIIRQMAKQKQSNLRLRQLLAHKRAMLYFTQPSTRTFLSFMAACQILGITCNEVRDPKSSSEVKRESRMDSVRMFSSYFDVIIMRSGIANFAECCAYKMNWLEEQEMRSVPVINAGAGSDEHPTQALLDMYTIRRTFDFDRQTNRGRFDRLKQDYPELEYGPEQKTYLFCGDIGRGRTVRSLATVLSKYPGVRMFFVSPAHPVLQLDPVLKNNLQNQGVEVAEFESLDDVYQGQPLLSQSDCVYMTRIQREHSDPEQAAQIEALELDRFQLTVERVAAMKEYAPILHPFPRDSVVDEIPTAVDSDSRAMYFRQARNGMWIRAALLVHLFDAAEELYAIRDGA